MNESIKSIKFKLPSPVVCAVVGGTASGKSTLLQFIVDNRRDILEDQPDKIIFIYEIWQSAYDIFQKRHPNIIFDTSFDVLDNHLGTGKILLLVDDKYSEINQANSSSHKWLEKLALVLCHHQHVNIFLVLHSPFYSSGASINRSFTNIILTCNHRDSSYVTTLQRQVFPGSRILTEAYRKLCRPFKPIVIYMNPSFPFPFISSTLLPSPETKIFL